MRIKIWRILLIVSCLFSAFMVVNEVTKIDFDIEEQYAAATKVRSDFVISHDFGWVKESLVTLHRDHWIAEKRYQQLYRKNSLLLALLAMIMVIVTVKEFLPKKKLS